MRIRDVVSESAIVRIAYLACVGGIAWDIWSGSTVAAIVACLAFIGAWLAMQMR